MRAVRLIVMGVGGLVIAVALSLGAYAIAGGSIGEPARPVSVPSGGVSHERPALGSASLASPGGGSGSAPSSSDHDEDD